MRIGARLVLGLAILLGAACNGPSPDEPACFSMGGLCLKGVDDADGGACASVVQLSNACPQDYICCVPKGAYGLEAGVPLDSGIPSADAAKPMDGASDARTTGDAKPADGSLLDAPKG